MLAWRGVGWLCHRSCLFDIAIHFLISQIDSWIAEYVVYHAHLMFLI